MPCPHSADSYSEVNTLCGTSRKVEKSRTYLAAAGFALLTSTKYQEKTQEAFLAEANIYKTKSINTSVPHSSFELLKYEVPARFQRSALR
jgi:hypothetical protein